MPRRDFSERADRMRTLLIFTVLQGFLVTVNPPLLPMSGAEAETVRWAAPWIHHIGAADPLTSLRLLSALFAVCSTILLERLWLRKMSADASQWALLLWAFSPALLLFGRMAQPYSLQALLTVVAGWALVRFLEQPNSWKRLSVLAASLIAQLYANPIAGAGLWLAANALKVGQTPWSAPAPPGRLLEQPRKTWLLLNALIAAAYLPWALPHWAQIAPHSPGSIPQALLNLATGLYSLAFGQAIPPWLLALTALLIVPYLLILARAAGNHRQWIVPAAIMALLGCAFMGPRALFLLPLLIVAVVTGIEESGRFGIIFGIALFAASAGGVWYYFGARNFIDLAYVAPQQQIAKVITILSKPADTAICIDGPDMDASLLAYNLPSSFQVRVLRPGDDVQVDAAIRHVWFIRKAQPQETTEPKITGTWPYHALHPFVPAPETYRLEQKYLKHVKDPPRYLYQVWEFRR